jgi:hypothetical protein
VDTLFAQHINDAQLKEALKGHTEFDYNPHKFNKEGIFSCYIDALTQCIHTSSYQKSEEHTFAYGFNDNIRLGEAWAKVRNKD